MTDKIEQLQATISGRVQGVWYRASTEQKARQLKLKGWVRNRRNGNVEFVAQGKHEALQALLDWSWQGSEGAKVSHVQFDWNEPTEEFSNFEIRQTE